MTDHPSVPPVVQAWRAVGFVWEVFFSLAIPTVLFALCGRWLDVRWKTSPVFMILGLIAALAIAFILVMRKAREFQVLMAKGDKNVQE